MTIEKVSASREVARLRKVAKRAAALDIKSPDLAAEIEILREAAKLALSEIAASKGHNYLDFNRKKAHAVNRRNTLEKHAIVQKAIDQIRAEAAPLKPTYEQLARRLDALGIKPARTEKWRLESVRFIDLSRGRQP